METVAIRVRAWRRESVCCPLSLPALLEDDEMVGAAGDTGHGTLTCLLGQTFAHVCATSEARTVREGPHDKRGLRRCDDGIELQNQGLASPPQLFKIGAALFTQLLQRREVQVAPEGVVVFLQRRLADGLLEEDSGARIIATGSLGAGDLDSLWSGSPGVNFKE